MTFPRAVVPDGSVRPAQATGANIAANLLVKFSAAGDPVKVVITSANDSAVMGVAMAAIVQDDIGDIQTAGRAIVKVGAGGVTAGDLLMPAATGKVVTLSAGAGTNVSYVGQTDVTAAEDDLIEIEFIAQNTRQG